MNGWDVLVVVFTAFYAFSVGRSVIFWTVMSCFYGFFIPLLLLVMPVQARKEFRFPQWFLNLFGPLYIRKTIKRMEGEFKTQ